MLDSPPMSAGKAHIKFLWIAALVFSSLACRAATRLIIPDTPTPWPTATATPTATQTPTLLPTPTATAIVEAACPNLLAGIVEAGTTKEYLQGDSSHQSFSREKDDVYLVIYQVLDGTIGRPHFELVPDDLEDEQKDHVAHKAIWNYFASIIPAAERELVSGFSIFTDGKGNHLAAVGQSYFEPNQWNLQVDIVDSASYYDLTYTLLHEQGHLLTLNSKQVLPSQAIFDNPEDQSILEQEVAACSQYFPGEGCSNPDSYINQFFSRFWMNLYAEWQQINAQEDEDTHYIMLEDFYKAYRDQFLTDYAPTSPVEDIAESWSFFILSPKPELTSIANEKILFFYEYPELIELRRQILNQICVEFPQ